VANRIGEEGKGWTYGKFLLDRERLGGANVAPAFRVLERTRALVAAELSAPEQRLKRELLEHQLLLLEAELRGARRMGQAAIDDVMTGRPLGITPSLLKLSTSAVMQRIGEVALDAVGHRLAPRFHRADAGTNAPVPEIEWVQNYMYLRARTVFGGSSEVQKNVIARQLFGS
jgi:alkylation response protein AidB-like acyl-CoA dehydrogenase